jgi:hypothetical protein
MGWNDHVVSVETECLDCGAVDVWECWDEVAKARYGGDLGRKLGHDIGNSDRCPHCGSTRGKQVDDDYDGWA